MRRASLMLLGMSLILLVPAAAAVSDSTADRYVNVSGPDFLKPYGPHDPRVDNPLAAGITAVVVAVIVLRGIRKYED
ncbi:MAG: hypothetical protein ABEK12_02420 [Candidatus Nanohaloarchaea archaeon]